VDVLTLVRAVNDGRDVTVRDGDGDVIAVHFERAEASDDGGVALHGSLSGGIPILVFLNAGRVAGVTVE